MKKKFYNSGQELLASAKKIIPGGNQLLSKRSERFHPNLWPVYYQKAKGIKIWDLDNKIYYDMSSMGVTSCVLGYADKDVNKSINSALNSASMTSLNCTEEVILAKKLIELHPWSQMARFARSGGEAITIALRISKAYNNKNKILFCGYHGWHDWYLSSNLSKKNNLDKQLLPGLKTMGVNKNLINTSLPFDYNLDSFKKVYQKNKNNISTIIMEPQRNLEVDLKLLKYISSECKKNNIILIFDEITSGFHENLGGLHMKYKIYPDIAVFSKALGNGVPISAIIGRKRFMDKAQDTFISSTMWTEKIGFAAAIATLKKMKKLKVQEKNIIKGKYIKKKWLEIANKHSIDITIYGLDSIPSFNFNYENSKEIMTYFTQTMLKKMFLANGSLTISFSHNDRIINKYLSAFDDSLFEISKIIKNKSKFKIIGNQIISSDFKRLN